MADEAARPQVPSRSLQKRKPAPHLRFLGPFQQGHVGRLGQLPTRVTRGCVRRLLKQVCRKQDLSGQVAPARLVLAAPALPLAFSLQGKRIWRHPNPQSVIPGESGNPLPRKTWTPAFAGVTDRPFEPICAHRAFSFPALLPHLPHGRYCCFPGWCRLLPCRPKPDTSRLGARR